MKHSWLSPSFSAQLILALVVLILLTTFSAGIPAYLLTRSALEQQAWSQVEGGRRATRSLLAAEEERLASLVALFAERPTLQRLVLEEAGGELDAYLDAFRAWLPTVKLRFLAWLEACREQPILIWHTSAVPGVPTIMMSDGPHGVRKQRDVQNPGVLDDRKTRRVQSGPRSRRGGELAPLCRLRRRRAAICITRPCRSCGGRERTSRRT